MSTLQASIAVNHFGLGARPGEIAIAASDPRGWLLGQLSPKFTNLNAQADLPATREVLQVYFNTAKSRRALKTEDMMSETDMAETAKAMQKDMQGNNRSNLRQDIMARARYAIKTKASFAERWVRFWSNHFTVSARKAQMVGLVGPFEREVIRPHSFGSFHDLLSASTFHPAMLVYLDNHRSVGPNTRQAKRRGRGLNENLAREILELHTLGVGGGYSQADVTNFAKTLTGWGLNRRANSEGKGSGAQFNPRFHETGSQTILEKKYAGNGPNQAKAVIKDLAVHPSTARHIAIKLALQFISDSPPETAINSLTKVFQDTEGDLAEMARAVIGLDAAWAKMPVKFKTPEEFIISAGRALGAKPYLLRGADRAMRSMGQRVFFAPSPDGWPDKAVEWGGPDAIKKRLEWANGIARRIDGDTSSLEFLEQSLGPRLSERTRKLVSRAENQAQGLTLALMSPEFQRR